MVDLGQKKVNICSPFFMPFSFLSLYFLLTTVHPDNVSESLLSQYLRRLTKIF